MATSRGRVDRPGSLLSVELNGREQLDHHARSVVRIVRDYGQSHSPSNSIERCSSQPSYRVSNVSPSTVNLSWVAMRDICHANCSRVIYFIFFDKINTYAHLDR